MRGMPIVSTISCLPQARIFPVGIKVIWRGTMSQLTIGPIFPVLASAGRAEIVTGDEVTLALPAVNLSV